MEGEACRNMDRYTIQEGSVMMDLNKLDKYAKSIVVDEKRISLLKAARRIIAISPHPDDAEIIAGGYLALSAAKGSAVRIVVVSDGRMGFLLNELTDYDVAKMRMGRNWMPQES